MGGHHAWDDPIIHRWDPDSTLPFPVGRPREPGILGAWIRSLLLSCSHFGIQIDRGGLNRNPTGLRLPSPLLFRGD